MKKFKINQMIEYLSPTLIFSYFFVHNIFLVLIGITFSLYLININIINNLKKSINNFVLQSESKDSNKNDEENNSNTIIIKTAKKETKLTLVEEIEEFGFIPSIDKKNNTNAA